MLSDHPAIADLPPISRDEYAALEADILQRGQEVPVVLLDALVWDGRSRYEICIRNGITPWLVPLRNESPISIYITLNYSRAGEPASETRKFLINSLARVNDFSWRATAEAQRRRWLGEARNEYVREWRQQPCPCVVCGASSDFSHAHHVFPLHLQHECGVSDPIQDTEWLCPVHHKKVHRLLSGYLLGAADLSFLDGISDEDLGEWSKIVAVSQRGIDLCCDALGKDGGPPRRYDPPFARYVATYAHSMFPWPRQS